MAAILYGLLAAVIVAGWATLPASRRSMRRFKATKRDAATPSSVGRGL